MRRGDARGNDKAVVVGVHHDKSSDEPRAHAPAGRPSVLELTLARLELDAGGFGKILPEEVRCPGLDGFAVLHHRFDAISALGAGEAFALALLAA